MAGVPGLAWGRRLAGLAALLLAALASAAPPVIADGDPASDVLLGQNVFVPYSPLSPTIERRLYAVCDAARRAGYPLRIALIASKSDLGVVPSVFGKPQTYARFLSSELAGVVNGPVLVVMPAGFGLAARGNQLPLDALAGVPIGAGADGLGSAAIMAAERLSAAAGHALPPAALTSTTSPGASPATVRHALTAMGVLAAFAAAGVAAALGARRRRGA